MKNEFHSFWLNVDKVNKRAMLHKASCKYAIEKGETDFVGIGEFKRDGGWFGFNTRVEAETSSSKGWAAD